VQRNDVAVLDTSQSVHNLSLHNNALEDLVIVRKKTKAELQSLLSQSEGMTVPLEVVGWDIPFLPLKPIIVDVKR
jgi:hypothetical protein